MGVELLTAIAAVIAALGSLAAGVAAAIAAVQAARGKKNAAEARELVATVIANQQQSQQQQVNMSIHGQVVTIGHALPAREVSFTDALSEAEKNAQLSPAPEKKQSSGE